MSFGAEGAKKSAEGAQKIWGFFTYYYSEATYRYNNYSYYLKGLSLQKLDFHRPKENESLLSPELNATYISSCWCS